MKKIFYIAVISIIIATTASAQYTQPNDIKSPIQPIFPTLAFDSIAAKNALAPGPATIIGLLYSKKGIIGESFKTVYIFPNTPYFKEWYDLKKKGTQVKKGIIKVVTMDSVALRYSYWCKANIEGKFSFPNLKPGKYILFVTVDRVATRTFDRYKGSGYDNYGGQTDYYSREDYSSSYKQDLLKEVEIPANEKIVNVMWKK